MAVSSIYLYQLVHDLARSLNDLWPPGVGTPAATFSTTGFTCTALMKAIDDFFNGWDIHFHAGTHKGQSRECTDYSSAYAVTFAPAVTGSVDATDLFAMF